MPSSRGSSQPRHQTQVSHTAGRFFTIWATTEAQNYIVECVYSNINHCPNTCVLRFMGSQRVGHDWATDLIWSETHIYKLKFFTFYPVIIWNFLGIPLSKKQKLKSKINPPTKITIWFYADIAFVFFPLKNHTLLSPSFLPSSLSPLLLSFLILENKTN